MTTINNSRKNERIIKTIMMNKNIANWTNLLEAERQQQYLIDTFEAINQRRAEGVEVFPPQAQIFRAFEVTPFERLKVVILGQDPYHGPGQAHGLCFSVADGVKPPPSLANIYKELSQDIKGFQPPFNGNLESWAKQGVLLLNTVLTVEKGQAHSHKHLGWEIFTDKVIQYIDTHADGIIFLLWGAHAIKKGQSIDRNKHFVLQAPHPSPLSAHRGFLGCRHFSTTNELLISQKKLPIQWCIN